MVARAHIVVALVAFAGCKQFNPDYCTKYHADNASYGCAPLDGGADSSVIVPVSVGGTVSGLAGTGLVLQDDNTDDLAISADGTFTFATPVFTGHPYAVSVSSQPSGPTQRCTVANGVGIAGITNITDVAVSCATSSYTVGGTLVGMNGGQSITLTLDGTAQTFNANGMFTFSNPVASGASFTVLVQTQPSGQTCSVSGGTGTVGTGNVTSVVVNCSNNTYTVGGTISGLTGTVTLLDNGGDALTLTSNGTFAFSMPLTTATAYAVTVGTQPAYPPQTQTCTVTAGSGVVATSNVTTVVVTCMVNTYTIGGAVSGLSGTLVLLDNGTDSKSITSNGNYTFATRIASGSTYMATVSSNPTGQTCTLANATGTVQSANVTNVNATCVTNANADFLCAGSTSCMTGTQQCCLNQSNLNSGTCVSLGSNCGGSKAVVTCDDAADCGGGGKVCCATFNSSGTIQAATCTQQNQCTGTTEIWCDPNASSPCPGNAKCTGKSAIPGRSTCQ